MFDCCCSLFSLLGVLKNCITMAMSKQHRERLTKNRVALVRDMWIGEELLSHLMRDGILTNNMKDMIEVGIVLLLFL